MKATRLFAFLITTFAAVALTSCNHKEEMEPTYDPGAVVFTVSSQAISEHGIDVVVKHNGGEMDGWIGFLTEDMTTPVDQLIREQAVPIVRKDFHYGRSQTVRLTDLDAEKDYRYIAYGMKDDKTIYGIPGVAAFTTDEDFNAVVFSVELKEVTGHEATFHVTHTGKETYTWYGFTTTDLQTDEQTLIAAQANDVDLANRGTDVEVSAVELSSDTEFKYIVFGVKEGGVVYGTPASVTFQTLEDLDGVAFTVTADNIEKTSADVTVTHNGREDYTWFGFLTEDLETAVDALVEEKAAAITDAELKSGKDETISLTGLQTGVTYRYIAAGYKEGALYGVPGSAEFTTQEHVETPYEKWLGKWEVTFLEYQYDDNGQKTGETNVTHTWEILAKAKDATYTIKNVSSETNVLGDVEAVFNADGTFSVKPQLTLESTYSGNPDLYYLCGMYMNGDSEYLLYSGDYAIFTASLTDQENATLAAGDYQGATFTAAQTLNQYNNTWYLTTGKYVLPNAMKKLESGSSDDGGDENDRRAGPWHPQQLKPQHVERSDFSHPHVRT